MDKNLEGQKLQKYKNTQKYKILRPETLRGLFGTCKKKVHKFI